jgi:hypothetical protein
MQSTNYCVSVRFIIYTHPGGLFTPPNLSQKAFLSLVSWSLMGFLLLQRPHGLFHSKLTPSIHCRDLFYSVILKSRPNHQQQVIHKHCRRRRRRGVEEFKSSQVSYARSSSLVLVFHTPPTLAAQHDGDELDCIIDGGGDGKGGLSALEKVAAAIEASSWLRVVVSPSLSKNEKHKLLLYFYFHYLLVPCTYCSVLH